jgi:hypothetical protein
MIGVVRRLGIALGSLVAAWLVVGLFAGLVGVLFLSAFGVSTTTAPGLVLAASGVILALVTIVLGGLIYRDIVRRDRRPN